jgi:hypothetical protein
MAATYQLIKCWTLLSLLCLCSYSSCSTLKQLPSLISVRSKAVDWKQNEDVYDHVSTTSISLASDTSRLSVEEYDALYDLYISTNGPNWHWFNTSDLSIPWNFTVYNLSAPCNDRWQGIDCNCGIIDELTQNNECHITDLILSQHNLTYQLPDSIGNFPRLSSLILYVNNLTGTIPPTIANLTELIIFDIHTNSLTGTFPEAFSQLRKLQTLDIHWNYINGTIPEGIYNLSNLGILQIEANTLTGTISSSIGQLTNLEVLTMQLNSFDGSFPSEIGNLIKLKILDISDNTFSSTFPTSLCSLTDLSIIVAGGNFLNGSLPTNLGNLIKLEVFDLTINDFTGRLPESIMNLTSIKNFYINLNGFFGIIPNTFFSFITNHMFSIDLSDNLFSGTIPIGLSYWKKLQFLDFTNNSFSKEFPWNEIKTFTHLIDFQIGFNFFTGVLPISIFEEGNSTTTTNTLSIVSINIAENSFSGQLPSSANWTKLMNYLCYSNYLENSIPYQLSVSSLLNIFEISNNYLTNTIPTWLSLKSDLGYLNITSNFFSGNIANFLQNVILLPDLTQLSLSYNDFTGTIPEITADNSQLHGLFLNNNHLSGTIPYTLAKLEELEVLLLQNNQLIGTFPNLFRSHSLQNLDISNNLLTGSLPTGYNNKSSLITISFGENCFHGTIPIGLCDVISLQVIALNGLSTAPQCRLPIFTNSLLFQSFTLKYQFSNSIPTCFYQMPNLNTLHLSGNGLTGSLPSSLNLSNRLSDLSLSHNRLTGTIPSYIQERSWLNLDLSYNKFTGTLSSHFHSFDSASSLSLEINRLSGSIPSSLLFTENIDLLEGNLFQCSLSHNDLPQHDSKASDYSCGSEVVNYTLYAWLLVAGVVVMFVIIGMNYYQQDKKWREQQKSATAAAVSLSVSSTASPLDVKESLPPSGIRKSNGITTRTASKMFSHNRSINEKQDDEETDNGDHRNSRRTNEANSDVIRSSGSSNSRLSNNSILDRGKTFIGFIVRLIIWRKELFHTDLPSHSNVKKLPIFLSKVRMFAIFIGSVILIVYMPIYTMLDLFYKQYSNDYAWVISGLYLSGHNAAIGMIILLLFLLFYVIFLFYFFFQSNHLLTLNSVKKLFVSHRCSETEGEVSMKNLFLSFSLFSSSASFHSSPSDVRDLSLSNKSVISSSSDPQHPLSASVSSLSSEQEKHEKLMNQLIPWQFLILSLLLIGLIDFVFMILLDIAYVYIIITYETVVILFSEILLAMLKTILNNIVLWKAIPFIRRLLVEKISQIQLKENEKTVFSYFSRFDLSFITIVILLNNIIFPIIAVFLVSPDCFYNALFQAANVTSTYSYTICDRYSGHLYVNYCFYYQTLSQESSYPPPFLYNYQCSSTIVTNYVSVFIIMFTAEGIIIPLLKLMIKFMNEVDDEMNNDLTDSGFSPTAVNPTNTSPSFSTRSLYLRDSTISGTKQHFQNRISSLLLPANLKSLTPLLTDKNFQENLLFDKNRLSVRLNAYLVVMMSFGALFPPLAFIICVTIVTVTIYEEIVIGRLLYESERLGYIWYKKQLERDCYGISDCLKSTLWSLVPVSSFLFAYIIFDIWGDQTGWESAILPSLLMALLPLFILLLIKRPGLDLVTTRYKEWKRQAETKGIRKHNDAVERAKEVENPSMTSLRPSEIEVLTITPKGTDPNPISYIQDIENPIHKEK